MHGGLVDEFVHVLRRQCGRDANPESLSSKITMRAAVLSFEEELLRRICGQARRRLLPRACGASSSVTLEAIEDRVARLYELIALADDFGEDTLRPLPATLPDCRGVPWDDRSARRTA